MWSIITAVVIGAIIGALARLILPGRQSISIVVTIILGILGSMIGSWIYTQLGGTETNSIDWIATSIGVLCAAGLIVLYGMLTGRKQT